VAGAISSSVQSIGSGFNHHRIADGDGAAGDNAGDHSQPAARKSFVLSLDALESVAASSREYDFDDCGDPQSQARPLRQSIDVNPIENDLLSHFPRPGLEALCAESDKRLGRHDIDLPVAPFALAIGLNPALGNEHRRYCRDAMVLVLASRVIGRRGKGNAGNVGHAGARVVKDDTINPPCILPDSKCDRQAGQAAGGELLTPDLCLKNPSCHRLSGGLCPPRRCRLWWAQPTLQFLGKAQVLQTR
jgi:hypothetical protein